MNKYIALLAAGCVGLLATTAFAATPNASPSNEEKIKLRLERIIIPKLEFRGATVPEALDFLKRKSAELNPKAAVNLRTVFPYVPGGPPEAIPALPPPGAPTGRGATPPSLPVPDVEGSPDARITTSLTNISLYEALRYVTGLAGLKFRILPDAIEIVPASDPDPMHTQDMRVPAAFFARMAKLDAAEHTDEQTRAKKNIRDYLMSKGVSFPDGAAAILDDQATRLTVHNTNEQLELIAAILNGQSDKPAAGSRGAKDKTRSKAVEAARRLASQIILTEVNLENISFNDAVREIQKLATLQNRPARRGGTFSMVIVGDAADMPQMSYTARNVPMWSALEAIARLAHYQVAMEESAVVFTKADSAATNPAKEAPPVDATKTAFPADFPKRNRIPCGRKASASCQSSSQTRTKPSAGRAPKCAPCS